MRAQRELEQRKVGMLLEGQIKTRELSQGSTVSAGEENRTYSVCEKGVSGLNPEDSKISKR